MSCWQRNSKNEIRKNSSIRCIPQWDEESDESPQVTTDRMTGDSWVNDHLHRWLEWLWIFRNLKVFLRFESSQMFAFDNTVIRHTELLTQNFGVVKSMAHKISCQKFRVWIMLDQSTITFSENFEPFAEYTRVHLWTSCSESAWYRVSHSACCTSIRLSFAAYKRYKHLMQPNAIYTRSNSQTWHSSHSIGVLD